MVVDNAWDDFVFLVSYKYNRVSRNGKKSITTHHFSFCRNAFLSLLLPSSIQNPLSVDSQYDIYCRLLILVLLCSSVFFKKLLRFCCWPSHILSSPNNYFLCYGGPLVILRKYFLFSNMLAC